MFHVYNTPTNSYIVQCYLIEIPSFTISNHLPSLLFLGKIVWEYNLIRALVRLHLDFYIPMCLEGEGGRNVFLRILQRLLKTCQGMAQA